MLFLKAPGTRVRLPPPLFLDALRVERLLFMYFFYILQCKGDRLYVGSCEGLAARFKKHEPCQGAGFTRRFPPTNMAYTECFRTRQEAIRREMQVKRWSEAKKRALIDDHKEQLETLSKPRDHRKT